MALFFHCYYGGWTWDYSSWEGSIRKPAIDKTLNSKCRKNVELKNKDKGSRKRKFSSSSDESDSDSEEDSSSEESDIDNGSSQNLQGKKCPRISTPYQGSLSSLQRKRINGNLASNWKVGQRKVFETHFWPGNQREYIRE